MPLEERRGNHVSSWGDTGGRSVPGQSVIVADVVGGKMISWS